MRVMTLLCGVFCLVVAVGSASADTSTYDDGKNSCSEQVENCIKKYNCRHKPTAHEISGYKRYRRTTINAKSVAKKVLRSNGCLPALDTRCTFIYPW